MIEIAEIVIYAIESILLRYELPRLVNKSLIQKLIELSNHSNKIK